MMSGGLKRLGAGVAGVVAAVAGLGAATTLSSASATTSPVVVQAYAAPPANYSSPVSSYLEPIAPDPDGSGEFFIVNDTGVHSSQLFKEPSAGGTPTFVHALSDAAYTVSFVALVNHEGYDWGLSEDGVYGDIGPNGTPTIYPDDIGSSVRDLAFGSDGNLYVTDNRGAIDKWSDSQENLTPASGYTTGGGVNPDAIAAAGGKLWFTDNSAQLYSLDPSGTGTFAGPYTASVSQYAHTLAADAAGNLWAVGGGLSADGGDEILEISLANATIGTPLHTYTSGLPVDPGITSVTVGPDGNIWFTESTARGIGKLDVSTGQITNYPLPVGYQLPAAGSDVIAAGPAGSGEVFFGAETTDSTPKPAIGVVSLGGTTTTTTTKPITTTTTTNTTTKPGSAGVAGTASVSSKHVASVPVSCHGSKGAVCAGTVTLSYSVKTTVKGTRKKKRTKKRTKVVTTKLGSGKYRLTAGRSTKLSVKLDKAGVKLLAAAHRHRLKVTETVKPASGKASTHTLTLIGKAAKRKK